MPQPVSAFVAPTVAPIVAAILSATLTPAINKIKIVFVFMSYLSSNTRSCKLLKTQRCYEINVYHHFYTAYHVCLMGLEPAIEIH